MKYIALMFIAFLLAGCGTPAGLKGPKEVNEGKKASWFSYTDPWNGNVVHCINNNWDNSQWCYVVGSENK